MRTVPQTAQANEAARIDVSRDVLQGFAQAGTQHHVVFHHDQGPLGAHAVLPQAVVAGKAAALSG